MRYHELMVAKNFLCFYKRLASFLYLILAIINLIGCVNQSISISPAGKTYCPRAIVIKPFENQTGVSTAGLQVSEAFQTSIVQLGWPVIERQRINDVLNESEMQSFLKSSGSDKGAAKLAKLLDADILILGKVQVYQQGRMDRSYRSGGGSSFMYVGGGQVYMTSSGGYDGGYSGGDQGNKKTEPDCNTIVGFSVRAINISNGSILWSITVVDDAGMFSYDTPVQSHAIKVVNNAIVELIKQGVNTKE